MGTRGFYIYRYKGRYYVYYNHWDSYPEGLGSWIVSDIPTDPDQYKGELRYAPRRRLALILASADHLLAWLNKMRATYAEFDKILEEQILRVSDADLKACADPHRNPDLDERQYRPPKRDVLINEKLEHLPSVLPDAYNDLFIEWVYTIDLDREVFSVDNGAHFHLDKIPRNDVWIKAVAMDASGLRTLDTEVAPKDCVAHPVLAALPGLSLLDAYQSLTTKPIRAKASLDLNSGTAHSYMIRLSLWRRFSNKYAQQLSVFLYGWEPQEFVFREFVYAVLCLASGDPDTVHYMSSESLQAVPGEGYRWFEGKNGKPVLLPVFMEGCHHPGIEPGISPIDAPLYWFGGVIICPTVQLNSDRHRNAAIAKAVAFGKESGRKWFDALLVSIEHVVLLRLLPGDVVEHTDAISLFSIPVHTSMYADHRPAAKHSSSRSSKSSRSSSGDSPGPNKPEQDPVDPIAEALQMISPGFVALIHLFDGAAYSQLKPLTGAKEGIFPTEIMHMILPYTDDETYRECAKASRGLRHFCQRNLRIFEDYTILSYKPQMKFAILNRKTDVVEHFHMCVTSQPYQREEKVTSWCPVIGANGRLGFLNDVEIYFTGLVVQPRHNRQVPHRMVDNTWQRPFAGPKPYLITQHQSVSTCLSTWERYLENVFPMGNNQVTIRRESHDYHFPPNTGVIYLHASYGYSERESAILWVWLRRPSDDREEMWEKSMSQAEEMMRKSKVRHSMWLLLAFGNRVRAFRWEPSEASSVVKQGERPSENKKETENDKGTEAEKSSDKGVEVGDAEHESEKETKGPNTTLIKAKGKQKATSDPNTAILKTGQSPEIHRNLIPKLDGQTLNTTVKKDSEAIEAFLRNARVGVPLSRGLSWIEPGEFDFDQ